MSRIRANKITNKLGTGAVELEKGAHLPIGMGITGAGGLNITGVVTATSFAGTTGTFGDFVDVGSNIKLGNAGVITATSFVGSGADLTGVTQSDTPLASSSASTIFYESDDEITVSDNTTLSRSSSNSGVIYTKYQQVVVANTKSLIVADGETFVVDAYALRTPDL